MRRLEAELQHPACQSLIDGICLLATRLLGSLSMAGCADPDVLRELLAGVLADRDAGPLRQHLMNCEQCQWKLDELSDHAGLRALLQIYRATPAPESTDYDLQQCLD